MQHESFDFSLCVKRVNTFDGLFATIDIDNFMHDRGNSSGFTCWFFCTQTIRPGSQKNKECQSKETSPCLTLHLQILFMLYDTLSECRISILCFSYTDPVKTRSIKKAAIKTSFFSYPSAVCHIFFCLPDAVLSVQTGVPHISSKTRQGQLICPKAGLSVVYRLLSSIVSS